MGKVVKNKKETDKKQEKNETLLDLPDRGRAENTDLNLKSLPENCGT